MRLRSQFLVQLSGAALNTLAFVALTPLLVSSLGLDRYGVLLLVLSFLIYAGLAEFGLGGATSREIAACQPHQRAQIHGNSLLLSCGLAAAGGLLFALLALPTVARVFVDDPSIVNELERSSVSLFALGAVTIMASVPKGVLFGLSGFISLNFVNLLSSVGGMLAPALYARYVGTDLSGLIASTALVHSLAFASALVACVFLRTAPQFGYDRSIISTLLSYGAWSTSSAILHRLTNSLDRVLISAFVGPSAVAVFAIPQGALNRSQILSGALLSAVFPRMARSPYDGELIHTCFRGLFLTSPFFVIGVVLLGPLLKIWLGTEFAEMAYAPSVLLAFAAWVEMLGLLPYTLLQARSELRQEARTAAFILLPNVCVLIVAIFFFGVVGAAAVAVVRAAAFLLLRARIVKIPRHLLVEIACNSLVLVIAAFASLSYARGASVITCAVIWSVAFVISVGLNFGNGLQLARSLAPGYFVGTRN